MSKLLPAGIGLSSKGSALGSDSDRARESYAITRAQAAAQENGFASVATLALVSPVVEREIVALTKTGTDVMPVALAFVEHFKKHAGKY